MGASSSKQQLALAFAVAMALLLQRRSEKLALQDSTSPTASAPACKRVALIRHGQGYHNRYLWMQLSRDAELTDLGVQQATALRDQLRSEPEHALHAVEAVISSPLSRAVKTALTVFADKQELPHCLCHHHTERCVMPCDTGSPPTELAERFPVLRAWQGFADLPEEWWPQGRSCMQELRPLDRVEEFKQYLLRRPESTLCAVGHAGFFNTMTGHHMHNCEVLWIELSEQGGVSITTPPEAAGRPHSPPVAAL